MRQAIQQSGYWINWLLFTACILLSPQAFAKGKLSAQQLSQRLKAYESIKELQVSFKQIKKLKDLGLDLVSEGELRVRRPDVWWTLKKPAPVSMHFSTTELSINSEAGAERKIKLEQMGGGHAQQGLSQLLPWLRFDFVEVAKLYEAEELSKNHFRFLPKGQKGIMNEISMRVSAAGDIEQLGLQEVSGDSILIQFEKPRKRN